MMAYNFIFLFNNTIYFSFRSDEEDSNQKYSRMEDDNIQDKERFAR